MEILTAQDLFVLGWEYGLCPFDGSKFDSYHIEEKVFHTILANPRNSISVLIKYDRNELIHE